MKSLVFWLYCRWNGHGVFAFDVHSMRKGKDHILWRECRGCGRVYAEDAMAVLDKLEADAAAAREKDSS